MSALETDCPTSKSSNLNFQNVPNFGLLEIRGALRRTFGGHFIGAFGPYEGGFAPSGPPAN